MNKRYFCCLKIWNYITLDLVAGITANTEQNIAPPLVPLSGPSPLQLPNPNETHMSIVASENAGLGPRELVLSSVDPWITDTLPPNNTTNSASTAQLSQQQSKIMNVVVPNLACSPAATKKIRRKPENKVSNPQSQINKCNNEKRRRELENEYIEQLGEFLQINKRDMTACKPDKAAILSEVVKKFRSLLEQRARETSTQLRNCNKCPSGCSDSCTIHPVQQGDVSSTEPPLPEPSINGHSPEKSAYFEAVQHYISNVGWALLEINSEGYIEYATENVTDVLHYSRQELCGQSIYSYLHTGDHNKISPILDKNTLSFEWEDDGGPSFTQTPKRTVRIRWLLKSPEDTIEQRQQRANRYKDLLIISAPVKDDADESSSVLCLITLPEDDQSMDTTMPPSHEQLTIRIDADFKIIKVDTTQLRPQFAAFLAKEIGHTITQLVHPQDRNQVMIQLNEVIQQNQTDAQIINYRLQIGQDHYVHTKVQLRMFPSSVQGEPDFVMAVHEILSDNEIMNMEQGNGSGFPGLLGNHSMGMHVKMNQSGIGGPLIGSVINGGSMSQISPRNSLINDTPMIPPPSYTENYFQSETFDFDFTSPTFEMENQLIDSRPESRTSMASVSTPRPSSATAAFSPATQPMCPSPLTPYSQPSPASITNNNNTSMTNNNLTNSGPSCGSNNNSAGFSSSGSNLSGTFQFNFDDKEKMQEQLKAHQQQQENNNTGRLRNLLMKSPSEEGHQILKNLLNSDDDKDHKPLQVANRNPIQRPRSNASCTKSDNMLLQLLNDNDEDKQPSELLRRLQSTKDTKELNNNTDLDNEQLKERLRFQGGPGSLDINSRKRPSDESDDMSAGAPKRLSKLQEKNKMLASLLAGPSRPLNATAINTLSSLPVVRQMPDIPNQLKHNIEQNQQQASTPNNQTIPNTNNKAGNSLTNNNTVNKNSNLKAGQQQQKFVRQQNIARQPSIPGGKNLSKMNESVFLSQLQNQQQQQQQQMVMGCVLSRNSGSQSPFDSNDSTQQFVSSSPGITLAAASSSSTIPTDSVIDPELSDILDNLFDDGNYNENPMMNLIQQNTANNNNSNSMKQQEELAQINKIQQSLMECEDEANFSGSPPAYQMHVAIGAAQQRQASFTQPPPGYADYKRIRLPQMSVTSNNSNNNALNNNNSNSNLVTNSNAAAIAQATNSQKIPSQAQIERFRLQQQVIMEKQRLLQQQQNQQILVTGAPDQLCVQNTGVQSIDSLLNNSVAPNVTLTSRGKMVPDSQLSPNFPQSLMHQQLSPNQQRTNNVSFSSQANQNFQQTTFNSNNGQRLSPQQQQLNQQLLNNFQAGNGQNANNSAQLSPRQPPFNIQATTQANQNQTWNAQSNNIRMNLQQSNPMLNAQLNQQNVGNFPNQRTLIPQRQRSLNSPGAATVSRQSSFNSPDFSEPQSPSAAAQQQYNNNIFNQQQMRLQRQQSIPQATQHLPGSPRLGLSDCPSGFSHNSHMMYSGGNDFYRVNQTGGQNNGLNSQMVRQGLRAVVGARQTVGNGNAAAGNGIRRNLNSPMDTLGVDNANPNNNPNNPNNLMISQQQQQQQNQQQQQMPNSIINEMDPSMRFSFDMPQDFFGGTNR
ncbi:hypothetical protein PVAND_012773 [Polypedilum vanderplanki]|uniref:BHLH domain-containing protein n=1 Tax=Polypedilum vanderplanki TaxID=319348 RepID=A0A9J6CNG7_POLVA|nr:hypothetical protein PVAND_012773 [Polypedilum vanderplanki]